jgi:hypothetical protein
VRGVLAGYSREQTGAEFIGSCSVSRTGSQEDVRLGDYAVTERMLQVCLGGGPGQARTAVPFVAILFSFELKPRGLPLDICIL